MTEKHPFFQPHTSISPSDIHFFSSPSHPLAAAYLSNPRFQPVPFVSRHQAPGSGTFNNFFAKVINTEDTVPHLLALARVSPPSITNSTGTNSNTTSSTNTQRQNKETEESEDDFIVLAHLAPSLCGFQDTVHGGVLAALIDEAVGLCAESRELVSNDTVRLYTAGLEIRYRAPVAAPSVVVIKTRVVRREGERKWWLEARMVDQAGIVLVEGRSLYISSRGGGTGSQKM